MKTRFVLTICLALSVLGALPAFGGSGNGTPQASITLKNSDVAYCYKQDASWTLTKTNDKYLNPATPGTVPPETQVTWTVTATRGANNPIQLCVIGYVSVTNTGSADATIGNIVVDLQRNTGKWTVISADVADASQGDAATLANIVAAALQGQTDYSKIVITNGAAATFTENSLSGSLSFTINQNDVWAITPQVRIKPGDTVNLFYEAVFKADAVLPALSVGEQLRTEVFVSFGNAGARGGSGSTGQNIDIDGGGLSSDEANVRTVPTRTTKALPALQICNETVTITDTFSTGTATVNLTTNPIGSGVTTSTSQTYTLIGTVGGSGTLSNTAELKGTGSTVTLTLGRDPITGLPITVDRDCCVAIDLTANSDVQVQIPAPTTYFTYDKGSWGGGNPDHSKNPGWVTLSGNFTNVYTGGSVTIGGTNSAKFTSAAAVSDFLVKGGKAGAFTEDLENPTSTSAGNFGPEVLALRLNVDFSNAGISPFVSGFGGLTICGTGTALDTHTISYALGIANQAIGGATLPVSGFTTYEAIRDFIGNLNNSWNSGAESSWAADHLVSGTCP